MQIDPLALYCMYVKLLITALTAIGNRSHSALHRTTFM